jgi:asparagine synthase (glutamine-hydrolysing)
MCGINGIYAFKGYVPVSFIKKMNDKLIHRGPDDEGYLFFNIEKNIYKTLFSNFTIKKIFNDEKYNLILSSRRLSIIDISPLGRQPMEYDNGNFWIVYNGEVFNYREIKSELQSKGYKFKSRTDTEVVLAAYMEWGENCVSHFNGQWAFVIYDKRKNILFCSRDRFGILPFYYYLDKNYFIFSSEIKALLSLPFIKKLPNENLICDYLFFELIDHTDETFFRNIKQIEPGHNIILNLKSKRIDIYKYYNLNYVEKLEKYSESKAMKYAIDIRDLLIDAVRIRLRADVPVGSCLSGGLDSSSIVAIINKLLIDKGIEIAQIGEKQKTFTASYFGKDIDESNFVKELAQYYKIETNFIYPAGKELWEKIDRLLYYQDGQFVSTSIFAQWKVMELASQKVKVILDGQGGDEIFAGYPIYNSIFLINIFCNFSFYNIKEFIKNIFRLYGINNLLKIGANSIFYTFFPNIKPYFLYLKYKHIPFIKFISFKLLKERISFIKEKFTNNLNKRLFYDEIKFSLPQLLHYEDRNGMAFSIEPRVPFIDHRLIEYVFKIPSVYKIHNGYRKWILRLAMKEFLPASILWRKDKIGFATPEAEWLNSNESLIRLFISKFNIKKYTDKFLWRLLLTSRVFYE